MTELTTDQRTALALITTLQSSAAVRHTMAAVADDSAIGKLAQRSADIQDDIGERLGELAEALAEGKVRIVEEGDLVREVSRAFREKLIMGHGGEGGEPASQVREAQLFLSRIKDAGVLR